MLEGNIDWLTKLRFLKGSGFYVLRDQDDDTAEFGVISAGMSYPTNDCQLKN
jgi:hypothetical protein